MLPPHPAPGAQPPVAPPPVLPQGVDAQPARAARVVHADPQVRAYLEQLFVLTRDDKPRKRTIAAARGDLRRKASTEAEKLDREERWAPVREVGRHVLSGIDAGGEGRPRRGLLDQLQAIGGTIGSLVNPFGEHFLLSPAEGFLLYSNRESKAHEKIAELSDAEALQRAIQQRLTDDFDARIESPEGMALLQDAAEEAEAKMKMELGSLDNPASILGRIEQRKQEFERDVTLQMQRLEETRASIPNFEQLLPKDTRRKLYDDEVTRLSFLEGALSRDIYALQTDAQRIQQRIENYRTTVINRLQEVQANYPGATLRIVEEHMMKEFQRLWNRKGGITPADPEFNRIESLRRAIQLIAETKKIARALHASRGVSAAAAELVNDPALRAAMIGTTNFDPLIAQPNEPADQSAGGVAHVADRLIHQLDDTENVRQNADAYDEKIQNHDAKLEELNDRQRQLDDDLHAIGREHREALEREECADVRTSGYNLRHLRRHHVPGKPADLGEGAASALAASIVKDTKLLTRLSADAVKRAKDAELKAVDAIEEADIRSDAERRVVAEAEVARSRADAERLQTIRGTIPAIQRDAALLAPALKARTDAEKKESAGFTKMEQTNAELAKRESAAETADEDAIKLIAKDTESSVKMTIELLAELHPIEDRIAKLKTEHASVVELLASNVLDKDLQRQEAEISGAIKKDEKRRLAIEATLAKIQSDADRRAEREQQRKQKQTEGLKNAIAAVKTAEEAYLVLAEDLERKTTEHARLDLSFRTTLGALLDVLPDVPPTTGGDKVDDIWSALNGEREESSDGDTPQLRLLARRIDADADWTPSFLHAAEVAINERAVRAEERFASATDADDQSRAEIDREAVVRDRGILATARATAISLYSRASAYRVVAASLDTLEEDFVNAKSAFRAAYRSSHGRVTPEVTDARSRVLQTVVEVQTKRAGLESAARAFHGGAAPLLQVASLVPVPDILDAATESGEAKSDVLATAQHLGRLRGEQEQVKKSVKELQTFDIGSPENNLRGKRVIQSTDSRAALLRQRDGMLITTAGALILHANDLLVRLRALNPLPAGVTPADLDALAEAAHDLDRIRYSLEKKSKANQELLEHRATSRAKADASWKAYEDERAKAQKLSPGAERSLADIRLETLKEEAQHAFESLQHDEDHIEVLEGELALLRTELLDPHSVLERVRNMAESFTNAFAAAQRVIDAETSEQRRARKLREDETKLLRDNPGVYFLNKLEALANGTLDRRVGSLPAAGLLREVRLEKITSTVNNQINALNLLREFAKGDVETKGIVKVNPLAIAQRDGDTVVELTTGDRIPLFFIPNEPVLGPNQEPREHILITQQQEHLREDLESFVALRVAEYVSPQKKGKAQVTDKDRLDKLIFEEYREEQRRRLREAERRRPRVDANLDTPVPRTPVERALGLRGGELLVFDPVNEAHRQRLRKGIRLDSLALMTEIARADADVWRTVSATRQAFQFFH